jgi:hypothetical protein
MSSLPQARSSAAGSVCGGVAQLVEHLLCKQGVVGSNPVASIFAGRPRLVRASRGTVAAGRDPSERLTAGAASRTKALDEGALPKPPSDGAWPWGRSVAAGDL